MVRSALTRPPKSIRACSRREAFHGGGQRPARCVEEIQVQGDVLGQDQVLVEHVELREHVDSRQSEVPLLVLHLHVAREVARLRPGVDLRGREFASLLTRET